jgi:hypothetical protein
MPLYFIDTDDGAHAVLDEDGHSLPGEDEAKRLAVATLASMAADTPLDTDCRVLTARVRGADGEPVYAAEFVLTGEWLRMRG